MYKVIKKFYDPILARRVVAGEVIEISDVDIAGYIPYVQKIETSINQQEVEERRTPAIKTTTKKKVL